jgi:FAD/FMN-containing dehydrogenase
MAEGHLTDVRDLGTRQCHLRRPFLVDYRTSKEPAMPPRTDLIDRYFEATRTHDVDALVGLFSSAGVVVDDSKTHRGSLEIRDWRESSTSQYEYTTTLIERQPSGDSGAIVTARLVGNFPGGTVDLQFDFHVAAELITQLTISAIHVPARTNADSVPAAPDEPWYLVATSTFNLSAEVRPAFATVARSRSQVVDAVNHARRAGMPVRVASTGHGATAAAPFDGSLLIRVELGEDVRIDPTSRTATVPAGTTWGAVVGAAAKHDLAAVHGSAASVGVIGYLLRGGVSFYGRQHGLAVNSLRSISIVLADGTEVVVSDDHEPDLFWALRGGGGGFGVVTEVVIDLFPMPAILTGATIWDAKHAAVITSRWARWTEDAPESISTSLRLMNLPAAPGIPPELTAGQILVIDGAVIPPHDGDLTAAGSIASDLFGPLAVSAAPLMSTWHAATPGELLQTHMDPSDPLPYAGHHILLEHLPEAGIEQFVAAAGPDSGPPLMIAELRQLGGAFATPARAGGALDRTAAHFAHIAIDLVPPTRTVASVTGDLRRLADALAPWNTGRTLPSVVEDYDAAQRTFDDTTAAEVAAVRRRFDPDGRFAHDVDPIRDENNR